MNDRVIDLGIPSPHAVEFYILRSTAIDAYSGLESSLSGLLTLLLGNDMRAATAIFHRLSNTKSRNLIIEDLLQQRFGETYSAFWHGIPKTADKRGLMNIVQDVDGKRNQLVHWVVVRNIGDTSDHLTLRPPSFFASNSEAEMTAADLGHFTTKANFAARIINMFTFALGPNGEHLGEAGLATWRETFQRPCSYPPPDSHPLSPNYKAPQSPPQSPSA